MCQTFRYVVLVDRAVAEYQAALGGAAHIVSLESMHLDSEFPCRSDQELLIQRYCGYAYSAATTLGGPQ
jgi:hypothetical protein